MLTSVLYSPALEPSKDLVGTGVLTAQVIDDLLNNLVSLALLLQVGTGLLLGDRRLELVYTNKSEKLDQAVGLRCLILTGGDLVVTVSHQLEFGGISCNFRLVQLRVEQVHTLVSQSLIVLLVI